MSSRTRPATARSCPRSVAAWTPRRRGGIAIGAAAVVALAGVTYLSVSLLTPGAGPRDAARPNDPSSGSASTAGEYAPRYAINHWNAAAIYARVHAEQNRELTRALSLVGITPRTLAASGVGVNAVAGVLTGAREHLAQHGPAFWAAMESARSAAGAGAVAERKVVTGTASEQEKTAAESARAALASALSAKSTALANLYTAATASLGAEPKAVLATLRANSGREFDLQFLAAERSQEQWVALRDAISNVNTAAKTGEEADPAMAALVASTAQEPAVAAASSNLGNALVGVASAWEQALAP